MKNTRFTETQIVSSLKQ